MSTTDVIRFHCKGCGHSMKVPSHYAGRKAKCKGCGEPVRVPEPESEMELELAEPVEEDGPSWLDQVPTVQSKPGAKRAHASAEEVGLKEIFKEAQWFKYAVMTIGLVWVAWLVMVVFGIDILPSSGERESEMSGTGYFVMAAVFTAILAPAGGLSYLNAKAVLTRGVTIPFEVIKFGMSKGKMQDVVVGYEYNGKKYRKTITIKGDIEEDGFALFIDPQKPKRALMRPED